jgi:integrase
MNLPVLQNSSSVTLADAQRVQMAFMAASEGPRGPLASTCRCYHATSSNVIRFLCETPAGAADRLLLNADRLLQWMIHDCGGRPVPYAVVRLGIVKRYLQALHQAGLTGTNLMEDFRTAHGRRPWRILVAALQSRDPAKALQSLETPPSSMAGPLHQHVQKYLETHESLGKQYHPQRQNLSKLDRHLYAWGVASPQAVNSGMIQRWADTVACNPRTRRGKIADVRRFFDYLKGMQIVTQNPLASARFVEPRLAPSPFRPFIFTYEQVASLLVHVEQLPRNHLFFLRGPACHLMLSLLYVLGLREGEARRISIRDVDLDRQTLMIVQTKFHKSRLVPFGPKLCQRLRAYLEQRRRLFRSCRDEDPLFVACHHKPLTRGTLLNAFRLGLRSIGLTARDNVVLPRLHDLRHTFAVHRLLRWYEEGIDVQQRLPILATFMGHVSILSTQVYLTITSDLLQAANGRFHKHFGCQFDPEVQP